MRFFLQLPVRADRIARSVPGLDGGKRRAGVAPKPDERRIVIDRDAVAARRRYQRDPFPRETVKGPQALGV